MPTNPTTLSPTSLPALYLAHARSLGLVADDGGSASASLLCLLDRLDIDPAYLDRYVVASYDRDGHCHVVDTVGPLDAVEAYVLAPTEGGASMRHRAWDLAAGIELLPTLVTTVRWTVAPRAPTPSTPPTP